MMSWIAVSPPTKGTFSEIWPVLLILVGVVLGGFIVIGIVRRWMSSDISGATAGFTLSDLRALRAEGKITREELERAEQMMIKRVRAEAGSTASIRIRPAANSDPEPEVGDSAPEDTE